MQQGSFNKWKHDSKEAWNHSSCGMCSNIHLCHMIHSQSFFGLIFVIFWNLIIYPHFLSIKMHSMLLYILQDMLLVLLNVLLDMLSNVLIGTMPHPDPETLLLHYLMCCLICCLMYWTDWYHVSSWPRDTATCTT